MSPVAAVIQEESVRLKSYSRIFVGFSGGLDSTVLLHALRGAGVQPLLPLHINHQLHPDADQWQRHCEALCREWGLELRCRRVAVEADGRGLEAAARAARYAAFAAEIDDEDVLLLAQHQDDQAETMLLRLLRGAGVEGLGAMPVGRTLGRGYLRRPLLSLPRSELLAYAEAAGLAWVEDGGNRDRRYDRNFLRHEVMPLLRQRWPACGATLARAAAQLREFSDSGAVLRLRRSTVGDPGFSLDDLPDEPRFAADAIRRWLRWLGLDMPTRAQLQTFVGQLQGGRGARLATPRWVLERYRRGVYARLPASGAVAPCGMSPGKRLRIAGVGAVTLCADGGAAPVSQGREYEIRFRRGGERLELPDGSHVALKTLFQSLGVPHWWRSRVPLLQRGDTLLAVGPFRSAPEARLSGLELVWEPELLHPGGADGAASH